MKVEFFHDVICSFCFPMAARMEAIEKEMPEIEVIHRSYALTWSETDQVLMFGTREKAKEEIVSHWVQANQNDDLHRFNIEGMKKTDFDFPTSRKGLLCAKAAGMLGGQKAYKEVFDKIQEALFVKNLNIDDDTVLEDIIKDSSLDYNEWKKIHDSDAPLQEVKKDLELAKQYGLRSVPALIVNEKYLISGALSKEDIKSTLEKIFEEENKSKKIVEVSEGSSCKLEDGKWNCD